MLKSQVLVDPPRAKGTAVPAPQQTPTMPQDSAPSEHSPTEPRAQPYVATAAASCRESVPARHKLGLRRCEAGAESCQPPASSALPIARYVTDSGMRVARYRVELSELSADFFGDPDGAWTYEELLAAAGFNGADGAAVGVLAQAFGDHPEGAAVVTLNSSDRPYVAVIECPIAFAVPDAHGSASSSAA